MASLSHKTENEALERVVTAGHPQLPANFGGQWPLNVGFAIVVLAGRRFVAI